jgi:hypothetical protein
MMLIAVGMSVATVNDFEGVQRARESGVPAMATVVRWEHNRYSADNALIRFTTRDGADIRTSVDGFRLQGRPGVGDQLQVLYDPADPQLNVLDPQARFFLLEYVPFTVIIFLLAVLAVLFWWPQSFFWISFMMKWRRGTADG